MRWRCEKKKKGNVGTGNKKRCVDFADDICC